MWGLGCVGIPRGHLSGMDRLGVSWGGGSSSSVCVTPRPVPACVPGPWPAGDAVVGGELERVLVQAELNPQSRDSSRIQEHRCLLLAGPG